MNWFYNRDEDRKDMNGLKTDEVSLSFTPEFVGTMTSPQGSVLLGSQAGGMMPYHLLYGALASCFYATFLDIVHKKRLSFTRAEMRVAGVKRDTIPTTLETVTLELIVHQPSSEEQFRKAAALGAKYCSIHETISRVAEITLVVSFSQEE